MGKDVIRTEAAPAPFQGAPYSQAIRTGDLVFVAGQLGLRPGDTAIEGGIAEQTEQVMRNLAAIVWLAATRTVPESCCPSLPTSLSVLFSSSSNRSRRRASCCPASVSTTSRVVRSSNFTPV